MKPGIIYVLVHPSDPTLVKVGRTVQKLERRIAQHNSDDTRVTWQIVKETGQRIGVLSCVFRTTDTRHYDK